MVVPLLPTPNPAQTQPLALEAGGTLLAKTFHAVKHQTGHMIDAVPGLVVQPTVSVVIPCFNGAPFLRETLDSALSQTHSPLEVLLVDDGSTDESAAIADSFGPPVRTIRQVNQGESVARNRAIEEALGDWVAFLDADDLWHPQKLERQIAFAAEHSEHVCVITGYYEFGDRVGQAGLPRELLDGAYDHELIAPQFTVLPSAALVRRSATTRFPIWTTFSEDGIYFNDLLQEGTFGFIDEALVGYRRHASSGQRREKNHIRACESYWRWAEQKEDRETAERLKRKLLGQFVEAVQRAKWKRDWQQFHELRQFCTSHWPLSERRPNVLDARVLPPQLYRVKDFLDRRLHRVRKAFDR